MVLRIRGTYLFTRGVFKLSEATTPQRSSSETMPRPANQGGKNGIRQAKLQSNICKKLESNTRKPMYTTLAIWEKDEKDTSSNTKLTEHYHTHIECVIECVHYSLYPGMRTKPAQSSVIGDW